MAEQIQTVRSLLFNYLENSNSTLRIKRVSIFSAALHYSLRYEFNKVRSL
jgi:hypothetical protein